MDFHVMSPAFALAGLPMGSCIASHWLTRLPIGRYLNEAHKAATCFMDQLKNAGIKDFVPPFGVYLSF
jgi:hypothetical protein